MKTILTQTWNVVPEKYNMKYCLKIGNARKGGLIKCMHTCATVFFLYCIYIKSKSQQPIKIFGQFYIICSKKVLQGNNHVKRHGKNCSVYSYLNTSHMTCVHILSINKFVSKYFTKSYNSIDFNLSIRTNFSMELFFSPWSLLNYEISVT